MAIIELSKEEKEHVLEEFYKSFETGRDFELFLNVFLAKLNFEEVVTTRYVGDQGIDITCIRRGFDPGGTDTINYYIQAKRYARNNKIGAKDIRDLKGTTKKDKNGNILNNNYVNVFITTSSFTTQAKEEAYSNPNMPVILIDGDQLISLCIEHKIGFNFKPVFSSIDITQMFKQADKVSNSEIKEYLVERVIRLNDIRAKILVIPQVIKNYIPNDVFTVDILINGKELSLNLNKTRRYLGGVTEIYKINGLISKDKTFISKISKWNIIDNKIIVDIV